MATDAVQKPQPHPPSFLGHAKIISALTLVSRIFGLLRETALAAVFGKSPVAVALRISFIVPNLLRKLFGEGALSAAFIPLYSKSLKEQTPEEARAFAAASVKLLTLILVGITIIGEIVLALMIYFAGPDRRLDYLLTLKLSAIMLPYVVLICLTAFLSAILQVHRRFALPAAAPILLNVIHIAVTAFGGWLLAINLASDRIKLDKQITLSMWLAAFVLVAGLGQVAMLVPTLRAVGFRLSRRDALWTPAIKRMLRLSIPVALAAGVLQISVLMDTGISAVLAASVDAQNNPVDHFTLFGHAFRYPMEAGAPVRLNWAQFLYQFPLGIFAIALATAIFPGLSSDALEKDRSHFSQTLHTGIEATLFEGVAASIGLIIVRHQAIRLFYGYGEVTAHDLQLTANSLVLYASGIWAYSMQQIINRAYYALHDTKTPFVMSIVNIAINLAVELPLVFTSLGESAMAAGTTVSFALQSLLMLYMLRNRIGGLGLASLARSAGKMILAAGLMWGVCVAVQWAPFWPHGTGKIVSLIQLTLLITIGGGVYLGTCQMLGVRTLSELLHRRGK